MSIPVELEDGLGCKHSDSTSIVCVYVIIKKVQSIFIDTQFELSYLQCKIVYWVGFLKIHCVYWIMGICEAENK